MEHILVTIDDSQSLASVRNAITKLRGVVSTSVLKNTSLSKTVVDAILETDIIGAPVVEQRELQSE